MVDRIFRKGFAAGLGLGAIAGLLESMVIRSGLQYASDFGKVAVVELIAWCIIGLFSGLIAVLFTRKPTDSDAYATLLSLRVILLLILIELGVQINFNYLPGLFSLKSFFFNIPLLLIFSLLWILTGKVKSLSAVEHLSRNIISKWYLIVIIAAVVAGLTVVNDRNDASSIQIGLFHSHNVDIVKADSAPDVAVIGLDSATWDIMLPLLDRGFLPNIRRLMETGTWGTLTSYKYSASPVVWTSIFTGKSPELHGITDFPVAMATNRRVKSLWQIAGEKGLETAVINVPGTYPVLGDCDVMLSGFPLPSATYTNKGWFVSTGPSAVDGIVPSIKLAFNPSKMSPGDSWEKTIMLKDLPAAIPSGKTTPALIVQRVVGAQFSRRLQAMLVPVEFGSMKIKVSKVEATGNDDGIRVHIYANEDLGTLKRGEWSNWLSIKMRGENYSAKIHFLETDSPEVSLYVTPYYPFPEPSMAKPADWIKNHLKVPYIAEGVGWQIFLDERLLETLRDHLMDIGISRLTMGLEILDSFEPDLFIYVVTMTDRIQHPMFKFFKPEDYRKLSAEYGGGFTKFAPTDEQVAKYRNVIYEAYKEADKWVGEILDHLPPTTKVVLVSDHGASSGVHYISPTAGIHNPAGVYIISTADGSADTQPYERTRGPVMVLEDVTPTVLYLLGLPEAKDMVGSTPDFLVASSGRIPEMVDSYEKPGFAEKGRPKEVDESVKEQLRSLGYLQ